MATWIAGKFGYVGIGAAMTWAFSRWSHHPRCKILPKNTFINQGFDDSIGGFIGSNVRLEGPLDAAATALVVGDVYVLHLGITATGPIEFTLSVRIADIEVTNDAEDEPHLTVNAVSKGSFDPAVLQGLVTREALAETPSALRAA